MSATGTSRASCSNLICFTHSEVLSTTASGNTRLAGPPRRTTPHCRYNQARAIGPLRRPASSAGTEPRATPSTHSQDGRNVSTQFTNRVIAIGSRRAITGATVRAVLYAVGIRKDSRMDDPTPTVETVATPTTEPTPTITAQVTPDQGETKAGEKQEPTAATTGKPTAST